MVLIGYHPGVYRAAWSLNDRPRRPLRHTRFPNLLPSLVVTLAFRIPVMHFPTQHVVSLQPFLFLPQFGKPRNN